MTKKQAIEILNATADKHEFAGYDDNGIGTLVIDALASADAFTDGAVTEAYRIANRLRSCGNDSVRSDLVERLCVLLGADPGMAVGRTHPDTGIVMPDQPSRPVAAGLVKP